MADLNSDEATINSELQEEEIAALSPFEELFKNFQENWSQLRQEKENELEEIKRQHKESIEKENEEHKQKMEALREEFKQKVQELKDSMASSELHQLSLSDSSSSDNEDHKKEHEDEEKYSNTPVNDVDKEEMEKFHEVNEKLQQIQEALEHLPSKSRDPNNYTFLLVQNKKQLNCFQAAIQGIQRSFVIESGHFGKLMSELDKKYYDLYDKLLEEAKTKY